MVAASFENEKPVSHNKSGVCSTAHEERLGEMELLGLILVGWLIWTLIRNNRSNSPSNSQTDDFSKQSDTKHRPSQKTFNVSKSQQGRQKSKPKITFNNSQNDVQGSTTITCNQCSKQMRIPSGRSGNVTCPHCSITFQYAADIEPAKEINLEGINDAFTGVQIDQTRPIFSCECGVFYQQESYELLRVENSSQCVACSRATISAYSDSGSKGADSIGRFDTRKSSSPRNYSPTSVTLENYKNYVNQVVTFEGYVHSIKVSRRGSDYAVMFENKSWTHGFKLVFFKGSMRKVGGARFVNSLKGRHIKVRGLLIKHQTFGYEIIINDPAMILEVSQ